MGLFVQVAKEGVTNTVLLLLLLLLVGDKLPLWDIICCSAGSGERILRLQEITPIVFYRQRQVG